MSLANDFSLEIANRVSGISVANGFETDIGLLAMRGRRRIDQQQLPCAVIIERPDEPGDQKMGKVKIVQKYIIEAHGACDATNPNDAAHKMISDIKRAVFKGNIHLDGRISANGNKAFELQYVGRSISAREDGQAVVSAAVEVAITYVEELSNP